MTAISSKEAATSKHWATLLSPSPSPSPSPLSESPVSTLPRTSPASVGPRLGAVSLPPLHTAVPLARLDTYRRPKETSISPIQSLIMPSARLPASAASATPQRPVFPQMTHSPPHLPARGRGPVPTSAHANGRPVLARLTTDMYSVQFSQHHLKSPRKRADQGQLNVLNRAFARSPYPSTEERDRLSRKLGMTSRSVQIWFQNKRRSVKVQQESVKQRCVGVVA